MKLFNKLFTYQHTFSSQPDTLKLGGHNRKKDEGSELYVPISKWHNHPNAYDFVKKKKYGEWDIDFSVLYWDYSLLQLEKSVKFTDHIQPAYLPSLPDQDFSGKDAYASGWGRTDPNDGSSLSDVPKTAKLKMVSPKTCKVNYRNIYHICEKHCQREYVICTYGTKDVIIDDNNFVEDACGGDSGGILFILFRCQQIISIL